MSRRNTLEAKRERRLSRSLRKGVLPTKCDLLFWMKIRSSLTTTECVAVALSGALKVDSHVVGIRKNKKGQNEFDQFVPTSRVGPGGRNIRIEVPEALVDG